MQKQSSKSLVRRLFTAFREQLQRMAAPKLHHEDLSGLATIYRLEELDSSWALINPDLNLWRYYDAVPNIEYKRDDLSRFRPLLLVHGYMSNHTTWNWMVNQLWKDGFRIIFAFEMPDYKKGFEHNMKFLARVVDYILEIEPVFNEIDILGHSMGGAITKHFIKLYQDSSKVRLFIGLGPPLTGVFKLWKTLASFDYAYQTGNDFTDTDGLLAQINEIITDEALYRLTQVNFYGSLRRFLGSDGFFKNKPVSDMINIQVSVPHYSLNKDEKVYSIIKPYLLRQNWFYKIRLLFIQNTESGDTGSEIIISHNQLNDKTDSAKDTSKFRFKFKTKGKRPEQYPKKSNLLVERGTIYIPTNPIIMFVGAVPLNEEENIKVEVHIAPGRASIKESINFKLDSEQLRYIELRTLIPSKQTSSNILIQLAIYMYHLPMINL